MKHLNKKGMSLLEVMVVVLLIAGLASMAYPAYLSSVEKGKATEAINLVGHAMAAQRQHYEENESYTLNFSDLAFDITGKKVDVSGDKASTDNFKYVLGNSSVTAEHKDNASYTYNIIGNYTDDFITCIPGSNAKNDKKICSTLGKESGSVYIIE